MQSSKDTSSHHSVQEIFPYVWKQRNITFLYVIVSLLAAATEGVGISIIPQLLSGGGNEIFNHIPLLADLSAALTLETKAETMQVVAIALFFVILARGGLQYAVSALSTILQLRVRHDLSVKGYNLILRLNSGYLGASDAGHMQNIVAALPMRASVLIRSWTLIGINALLGLVYVAFMYFVSVELSILSTVFILLCGAFLMMVTKKHSRKAGETNSNRQSEVNHIVYETIHGLSQIRLSGAEHAMKSKFYGAFSKMMRAIKKITLLSALQGPAMATIAGTFVCALIFAGSIMYGNENDDWTTIILMFVILLFRLISPASTIITARSSIHGAEHAFVTLQQFYDDALDNLEVSGDVPFTHLRNAIQFDGVSFTYPGETRAAIEGLSLTIPKGKTVAVVGESGSGKSTLVSLLTRVNNPSKGNIYIDGVDIKDLDISQWRSRVSMVSQNVIVFNDDVWNNISFGQEGVSREQIKSVAVASRVDAFVDELPKKYDTVLGDHGERLSGGQRQRIAIARAMLCDPDVLILDEATSNLDSATEHAIKQSIDEISKDKTLIIVAHRLSTVRNADKIIVMADGRIVESGTHAELSAKGGAYNRLLSFQES